ncbi:MAG: Ig-like domain-containing protein [Nitrospiria bacterium]
MTVTPAELTSITVTPTSASILVGSTQQFSATGTYTDGSTKDLTTSVNWVSSDTNIAIINNNPGFQGIATSLSSNTGSTTITASVSGITSNQATLTVYF